MTRRTTDAEHLGRLDASPYRLRSEPLVTVAGRSTLRGSWRKAEACAAEAPTHGPHAGARP